MKMQRESELIYRLVQSASQLKWPWWFSWGMCVYVADGRENINFQLFNHSHEN